MIRLVTRGRFTHDYAKGTGRRARSYENPQFKKSSKTLQRRSSSTSTSRPATADFLWIITEGNDAEISPSPRRCSATAAAGTISDISTARAWTGAEFKAVAEKASKAAKAYKAPGKH